MGLKDAKRKNEGHVVAGDTRAPEITLRLESEPIQTTRRWRAKYTWSLWILSIPDMHTVHPDYTPTDARPAPPAPPSRRWSTCRRRPSRRVGRPGSGQSVADRPRDRLSERSACRPGRRARRSYQPGRCIKNTKTRVFKVSCGRHLGEQGIILLYVCLVRKILGGIMYPTLGCHC